MSKKIYKRSNENKTVDYIPGEANSNSKIIFMIDSKTKLKDIKIETKKEEKKDSLWDKIKGLFN